MCRKTFFVSILLSFFGLMQTASYAYETDQYSFLDLDLKDASIEINNIINQGLKAATSRFV
mgnify:FL=1